MKANYKPKHKESAIRTLLHVKQLYLSFVPDPVLDHGLRAAHVAPRVGRKTDTGEFWSGRVPAEFAWVYKYIDQSDAGTTWATLTYDCDDRQAMAAGLDVLPYYNWLTRTERGGHATWCLAVPVGKHAAARAAPEQFLARIGEYFHATLKADPAFNGLGRNPAYLEADTIWGRTEPYTLDDLATVIPFNWRKPKVSQTGIGRNRDMLMAGCRGASANRDIAAITILHSIREQVCGLYDADHPYTLAEMNATAKVIERYREQWNREGHKPAWLEKQARVGRMGAGVPRAASLFDDKTNENARPWVALGTHRATWYRRRAVMRQANTDNATKANTVNAPFPCSISLFDDKTYANTVTLKPWQSLGISRATWYRRGGRMRQNGFQEGDKSE